MTRDDLPDSSPPETQATRFGNHPAGAAMFRKNVIAFDGKIAGRNRAEQALNRANGRLVEFLLERGVSGRQLRAVTVLWDLRLFSTAEIAAMLEGLDPRPDDVDLDEADIAQMTGLFREALRASDAHKAAHDAVFGGDA